MATNLPFTGRFKITCEYGRKNTARLKWGKGSHPGIDIVGISSKKVYGTCDGKVARTGYDKSYGNFVVVKESGVDRYHWFCHLESIARKKGDIINRASMIGIMGKTGNVTGTHLHYEIRNASNKYGDDQNPADYMGIPNKVGIYESDDYQIREVPDITYKVHISRDGWLESKENGEVAGTKGESLGIEAFVAEADIPIWYKGHMQDEGDIPKEKEWLTNGEILGSTGKSKRLEEITLRCDTHKLKVSAHVQDIGDIFYTEGNQITIGTRGRALRLEALTIQFV
jgi:uncharacterized protein YjdB